MPYIYKIRNKTNGKQYIGKTLVSPDRRFNEHCCEARSGRCGHRPQYRAMNKYGVDQFELEVVEECPAEALNDRERYWIEHYKSFKHGYNATIGGDGSPYIDYDLVLSTYSKLQNQSEVSRALGIHEDTVRKILKLNNIQRLSSSEINKEQFGKAVYMYDKQHHLIRSFGSMSEAAQYLMNSGQTGIKNKKSLKYHISQACRGIRKSVCGFYFEFVND